MALRFRISIAATPGLVLIGPRIRSELAVLFVDVRSGEEFSMTRVRVRSAVAVLAGLYAACSSPSPAQSRGAQSPAPGQVLATDATIRYVGVEGGCWAIDLDSGQRYEPVNLAVDFRKDGLRVHVELRAAPDMVSTCMLGPLVTVESISVP